MAKTCDHAPMLQYGPNPDVLHTCRRCGKRIRWSARQKKFVVDNTIMSWAPDLTKFVGRKITPKLIGEMVGDVMRGLPARYAYEVRCSQGPCKDQVICTLWMD